MVQEKKRLIGVRRVSLEGLGEEWGPECYALYLPATFTDKIEVMAIDVATMTSEQQVESQEKMVRSHFIKAVGKEYLDSDFVLCDLTVDEATKTPEVSNRLYIAIMGVDVDPKATRPTVTLQETPTEDGVPTETTSSETSATS